jgi:hypothetical protein
MTDQAMTVAVDDSTREYLEIEARDRAISPEAVAAKLLSDHVERSRDYDGWLVREIEQALQDSLEPDAVFIPHEVVMEESRKQREEILSRSTSIAA